VAAVAAQATGLLDDGLRSIGIRPHAEPDPHDVRLLAQAASELRTLLAQLREVETGGKESELAPLRSVLTEQLAAISDDDGAVPAASSDEHDDSLTSWADRIDATADSLHEGALTAGSLAVTQVLASMSAGLDQISLAVRDAA
jgi:hypothetical protein